MEDSINQAKKFVEDVMSFYGLNVDVYATSEEDVVVLKVPSTHLNRFLIGNHGDNIRALQTITSNMLKNKGLEYNRVNLDIADYKSSYQDKVLAEVEQQIKQLRESAGGELALRPMNSAVRRLVHKLAGDYSDIVSESEGEGRDRHIVLTYHEVE